MQFLNDLIAQWGGGNTPWAQEQMRRMQQGGMPTPDVAAAPSPAMMPMGQPRPPQVPMQSPMPRQAPMAVAGGRIPAAPTERAPEPAAPSMGTYMAGALRGAAQANNPIGAILGAVGGAMGAGDEVGQANQTYRLLVSKGVPEADAALAVKNPRYMQQLLGQLAQKDAPMSEADRLDLEMKRAQIDKLRGMSGAGVDDPASIREWQAFNKMSPEDQARYLTMKRAEKYLDTGTAFVRPNSVDPTAPPTVTVNKDLAGAERDKAIGEAQGKAIAAAPGDLSAAEEALYLVNSIRNDPNLDSGTAVMSPLMNLVPKTPGYDFQNKVNQAKSGAFLTAIQSMRNLGALSNAEGQTATQAINRMNTATSKDEFLSALADYERTVRIGRDKAAAKMKAQETRSQPQGATVLDEARAAIAKGAPRDAVIKRLKESGIDPGGL